MNDSKSLLTLRAQHFFNQSARKLFKIYYLLECSSKSFDSPKFLVQVLGFFQIELRMIISFDVKNRRQFFRAARTALWILCMVLVFLIAFSKLCLWFWLFFAWPLGGLAFFPIAPKEANKKLSYHIFFRPRKSFNYCNTFNLCFNTVCCFSEHFFLAVTSLQKEDVFSAFLDGDKVF